MVAKKQEINMKLFSILLSLGLSLTLHANNPYSELRQAAVSGASGTPWSSERQLELVEKANAIRPSLIHENMRLAYPISEEDLKRLYGEQATVPFFAYSSMIDKNAGAVKAISPEGAATQTPAVAFGIQRTFNRQLPAATVEGGYGALRRPNDVAILNSFEKEDAVINGVAFQLSLADLMILSKREAGYGLIPVLVTKWEDATNGQGEPEIFLAYAFLAPDVTINVDAYTSEHVNPIPGYVKYLQTGLDAQSSDFKAMWWATTFLADKKTSLRELPYHEIDLKARD
jgi:hypothetical protein